MSAARKDLQEALLDYTTDTLTFVHTVRRFCHKFQKWTLWRETELDMMMDIKDRADRIDLSFSHVKESESKGKALWEFTKNKFQMNIDKKYAELEKELTEVVKDLLEGLEELSCFLAAVEKLAVTSLHVFADSQALRLPEKVSFDDVQVVIVAARLVCPLLLEFRRDADVFFLPKRQNLDVLVYQLDRYVQTSRTICEKMEKSCFSDFSLEKMSEIEVNVDGLCETEAQRMFDHISQLDAIREDSYFRTVFLFQEESSDDFIREFSERQPRMLEFLRGLEENAVQLDRMCKGAKISSVAGSSVGAVGGVLSIVGLALIPVTAGASFALTMTGLGMGITSGVNSMVTTATEVGVNHTHQKRASELFQSFMEDVMKLQDCLEEVSRQTVSKLKPRKLEVAVGVGKVFCKAGTIGKGIDSIVDAVSAAKLLKAEEVVSGAGKVLVQEGKALRNVPRVAQDIPDVGQAAAKGTLAASKTARAGLIALNALFLGMDIFFICKDSVSLARGSETYVSQFIRARSALWSSEIDSWRKTHDAVCTGLTTSGKQEAVLETPFYLRTTPETETPEEEGEEEDEDDFYYECVEEKQIKRCVIH